MLVHIRHIVINRNRVSIYRVITLVFCSSRDTCSSTVRIYHKHILIIFVDDVLVIFSICVTNFGKTISARFQILNTDFTRNIGHKIVFLRSASSRFRLNLYPVGGDAFCCRVIVNAIFQMFQLKLNISQAHFTCFITANYTVLFQRKVACLCAVFRVNNNIIEPFLALLHIALAGHWNRNKERFHSFRNGSRFGSLDYNIKTNVQIVKFNLALWIGFGFGKLFNSGHRVFQRISCNISIGVDRNGIAFTIIVF